MNRHRIVAAFVLASLALVAEAQDRGLAVEARALAGDEGFEIGRQYAVIVGIDEYANWPALAAAREEAERVRDVLSSCYYIDEFIELYDGEASARNLRRLFAETLPGKLGIRDSLLVFYAGHGQVDASGAGFWIPSDGSADPYDQGGWLSNSQLRGYLGSLKAQRILVVADACFAGELLETTRGAMPQLDSAYYRKALSLTARQVLTSGASEQVPDRSEFGLQFVSCLERNLDPYIDALTIYDRVRRGVTRTLPLFGTLPGNQLGASFVLFRKGNPDKGVVSVSSSAKFRNWILPDASPGTRIEGDRRFELEPGDYTYCASLPEDEEATYSRRLRVEAGGLISIALPELGYSKAFQVKRLQSRRSELSERYATLELSGAKRRKTGWACLAAGLASGALAAYGYYDGMAAIESYTSATSAEEAAREWKRQDRDRRFLVGGEILAGILCSVSIPFLGADPGGKTRAEIADLDARIGELSR